MLRMERGWAVYRGRVQYPRLSTSAQQCAALADGSIGRGLLKRKEMYVGILEMSGMWE